jgi:3D (Asp-Asp-Asp) domain-containing protein
MDLMNKIFAYLLLAIVAVGQTTFNNLTVKTNLTVSGVQVAAKVNTIADLVAMVPTQDGMLVETLGYYAAGDGGGLPFRYVAGSTAATNLGTVFSFNSGTGRAIWIGGDSLNVRAFGVVADSSTDNTTAMQAALDYGASSGVPIYVPASSGQSIITDGLTLTGFVTLIGENDPAALNTSQAGVKSVIRLKSSASQTPLFLVPSGIQCSVRGIAFDGDRFNNGSYTNALIECAGNGVNYDKRSFENVSVRFAKSYGIKIQSAEVTLSSVAVFDGDGIGIWLQGQDTIWNHVLVGRNGGDGIYVNDVFPYTATANRWNNIDSFQNQGYGINCIIPFNGAYNKIVCNLNLKGGFRVDSNSAGVTSQLLRWYSCEFVDNNAATFPVYTSRSTQVTSNTPYSTATYSNFETAGVGNIYNNLWLNCRFTLNEAGATKVQYGFNWTCTGNTNGYSSTFINCEGNAGLPSSGLTFPATLFSSSLVNSLGSGDSATFSLDGSSMRDFTVGRNIDVTGTSTLRGVGTTTGAFNVGNGSQTGTSGTATLSVTHNTTVSSFLQSIISGQPTIRFRNLGSANVDLSDASNGRVGQTWIMASGQNNIVFGGNSPGPAVTVLLRSPDSSVGTNLSGGNLTLNSGRGTGAGASSTITMQLPVVAASGTTQQVWATAFTANSTDGFNLGLGGSTGVNFRRLRHGRETLVAGTATVSDIYVTGNTRIMLSVSTLSGTQGLLSTGTRIASTSFVINSSSALDTSVVDWVAIEP